MNSAYKYFIFVIPLIVLAGARLTGGFDGLYGQDAYEYYRYAEALKDYFITGTSPGDYFWPVWYPLAGALLSFIIPDITLSLQIISSLSLSLIFWYSLKLIQLLFPGKNKNTYIFTGLLIIVSPFMLRFGLSVMADMFTTATLVIGTYYIFQFVKNRSVKGLCIGILLYSISFMTRYAVAIIILPIIILAIYSFFEQKVKWYIIPLMLIIGIIPIVPHILIRTENAGNFIFHDWLTYWSPLNFFRNSFTTRDGTSTNFLPNILYALLGLFHPRYFLGGAIIILIGIRKIKGSIEIKTLFIAMLLYLLFIAGIPFQNNRFLLLVFPFLLIVLYPATEYILQLLKNNAKPVMASIIIMGQVVFFILSFKKVWHRSILEKEIYEYIVQNKSTAIYTMDLDISLKGRGYQMPVYNIYNNYYSEVDTNAMVIFNTEVFPQQWNNMNPMKNWDHFNKEYHLKQVRSFNQGWKAYVFR